ncbi:trimeric intracellular cation channel family protein [Pedococcus sp. 5OH_020]|uniref:trimeric intracellular cation channel family protein n=1 Tax=Pedococcus sp. 5OH_020 TaxID=2989814 RepID=UPI0022E9EB9E|nr:trimeric intracellular cation channel family protein [Pedococcus sp. 5OH_020]
MPIDGLSDAFRLLDLGGVFANALLGGVIARRERLDPIGFATLAVLSGLGGGLIRDVLLQHGTPMALTDYAYLLTAFAGAAASYLADVQGPVWDRIWPVVDAIALGCWATAGATKTLAVGLGWLPAVLLGVVTAVGGGAVRDVVLRRVPGVLGGNTLYATAALAGAGAFVVVNNAGHPTEGSVSGLVVGAGLCLVARWRGWILPSADAWSPANVVPIRYRRRLGGHVVHARRRRRMRRNADRTPTDRPRSHPTTDSTSPPEQS